MLVGYARVSTRDQTPELQIGALRGAGCEKIFTETSSGAARNRPELAAALDYLRADDTLVVWKLDRLARSLRTLVRTIDDLAARNIGFRSLTETIDTTSPTGRLVFHIFSSLAEFERELTRERTLAGLEAARARGHHPGRPAKLGPKELQQAQALLRDPAIRVSDIAARLNVAPSTLYRHLPAARTQARIHHPNPVSDNDRALLLDYLTTPPDLDDPDDTVPASLSETIGHFVLHSRSHMPEQIRTSSSWRAALAAALPTDRARDPQRYTLLKEWLFHKVLPRCQPIADAKGRGPSWSAMLEEPGFHRCRETMHAIDGRGPENYDPACYALSHAAQAAAELFPEPPHAAPGHRIGSGQVADVLQHVVDALVAGGHAETEPAAWTLLEPAELIRRLIDAK